MRRKDREITKFDEIIAVMEQCDVCRLALNRADYPYILPLNFGISVQGHQITLYFHGALEGTKYALMEQDSRAGFEMDCAHRLVTDEVHANCTMAYASVIGTGRLSFVPDAEKEAALQILMAHYHKKDFPLPPRMVQQTRVFRLTVEQLSAKALRLP